MPLASATPMNRAGDAPISEPGAFGAIAGSANAIADRQKNVAVQQSALTTHVLMLSMLIISKVGLGQQTVEKYREQDFRRRHDARHRSRHGRLCRGRAGDPDLVGHPVKGKMLIAADGARLAPVYRVGSEGPQVILDGRMVTVPSNTLAVVDGKLETTLTKAQVIALP